MVRTRNYVLIMMVTLFSGSCDHETNKIMSSSLKLLSVLVSVLTFFSQCSSVTNVECKKTDGCKCALPDGIRLDLTRLNDDVKWLNATLRNVSFFFHACSDIPYGYKTGSDDCTTGSSVCLFNKTTNTFQNLGTMEEGSFLFSNVTEFPIIFYKHKNFTTAILLQCVYSRESSLTVVDIHDEKVTHQLKLESIWACPLYEPPTVKASSQNSSNEGLSVGSVLVIIFFVFTTLYFVGGAVALRFLRGAEGKEMIPNYDFWVDLPNLVKDGTTFVINGCQTSPSYDRI